jgi:hypothetical protein
MVLPSLKFNLSALVYRKNLAAITFLYKKSALLLESAFALFVIDYVVNIALSL